MKNYYEILEVDKNASQEVIEKAYKVLAKKYHPDLQQGAQKQEYAEKMKIINDAYEVLSDKLKREEYNQKLNRVGNPPNYQEADVQEIRNSEHKIKYKHDFKYYLKMLGFLGITFFVCFLIYQIPVVKQYFQNLYNDNIIFHSIVDVLKNTFSTGF